MRLRNLFSSQRKARSRASNATDQGVRLSDLARGDAATFSSADLSGEDGAMLCAMGLREECKLRMCRMSRTCCIIQVDATRLALTRSLAQRIRVTPLTVAATND